MLTYKEIHLLVEQGLNSVGIFTEMANLRELVDLAFKRVLNKEISRLMQAEGRLTSVDSSLYNELTADVRLDLEKGEGYNYYSSLSSPILSIQSALVTIGSSTCTTDETGKGWYKVVSDNATYKGKNYVKGDKIKIEEEDLNFLTYGEAKKLKTTQLDAIITDKGNFVFYQNSASYKYNFPILTYDKNQVKVYYQSKYRQKESDVPLSVDILGLVEFSSDRALSWCNKQLLDLPENLQVYLIDKVVSYLAIVNRHPQQNVVNLKTETIT